MSFFKIEITTLYAQTVIKMVDFIIQIFADVTFELWNLSFKLLQLAFEFGNWVILTLLNLIRSIGLKLSWFSDTSEFQGLFSGFFQSFSLLSILFQTLWFDNKKPTHFLKNWVDLFVFLLEVCKFFVLANSFQLF